MTVKIQINSRLALKELLEEQTKETIIEIKKQVATGVVSIISDSYGNLVEKELQGYIDKTAWRPKITQRFTDQLEAIVEGKVDAAIESIFSQKEKELADKIDKVIESKTEKLTEDRIQRRVSQALKALSEGGN